MQKSPAITSTINVEAIKALVAQMAVVQQQLAESHSLYGMAGQTENANFMVNYNRPPVQNYNNYMEEGNNSKNFAWRTRQNQQQRPLQSFPQQQWFLQQPPPDSK